MTALPTAFTVGKLRAASLQQLYTVVSELKSPYRAQLRQTVAQTFTTGTGAVFTFDAEDRDSANAHSTSSNTSRYVIPGAGDWCMAGGAGWVANATGVRSTLVRVNGSDVAGGQLLWSASSAFSTKMPIQFMMISLALNDIVEVSGIQTSGGNLNSESSSTTQSTFSIWCLSLTS